VQLAAQLKGQRFFVIKMEAVNIAVGATLTALAENSAKSVERA